MSPQRAAVPWDSIWNYPLGDEADLVDAEITIPSERTLNLEEDIIIAEPDAPKTNIYEHDAAWKDGVTRCGSRTGDVLARGLPIPWVWLLPWGWRTDPGIFGGTSGYHGRKPNHAAAIVREDLTLFETQPFHLCGDGVAVSQFHNPDSMDGDSIVTGGHGPPHGGSHGGSRITAFGGTIRVGEWVPGGEIPHATKIVLYSPENLSTAHGGYRWPALTADKEYLKKYGGSVPELRMGSLLALPPSFDVDTLSTEPARILARSLQRYGTYVVDGSGWSTIAFATEWGPNGRVSEEFEDEWGFPLFGSTWKAEGAQRDFLVDMKHIYAELSVVDDNGPQSIGGAGDRMAPWAPPFTDGTGGGPN